MAKVHGKGTAFTIDAVNIGQYSNEINFNREVDSHDVTCFGASAKAYAVGLKDGTAEISGVYDNTAVTSPGLVLRPLVGDETPVEFIYQPEGVGASKPQASVDVFVVSFEESAPVADMVTWSATLQFTGPIDDTPQSA